MEFLYSAYFNGNITDEQLKFLESMGYKVGNLYPKQSENTGVATSSSTKSIHFIPKDLYFNQNPYISWNVNGRINCWKNWDMFTKVISISNTTNQLSPVKITSIESDAKSRGFAYEEGDIVHLNEIPLDIFLSYKIAELTDLLDYFTLAGYDE